MQKGCAKLLPTYGNDGPPAPDEVEVSIFGPGRGESILLHLGEGQWIVVDSCIDQADGSIPALVYLDSIGVDPSVAVKLVVGTHAHDDHIAGLARVVQVCSTATFVCSAALSKEEFYALAAADQRVEGLVRHSSYREYRSIFGITRNRGHLAESRRPLKRAVEELALLDVSLSFGHVKVFALSPSHEAVTRAQVKLAEHATRVGQARQLASADPNELAVALWIEVGSRRILLGADLLDGPAQCGWQGVLDWFAPTTKAELFKVPHHGSPNAHWAPVWTDLLIPNPLELLTPFRAGKTPRPAQADILRLNALTPRAYIVASPKKVPPPRRIRSTAAIIGQLARDVREPWGKSGQVRARASVAAGQWEVATFPPARRLSELS